MLITLLTSCTGLSGFAPKKGSTGEEFLIQKKNALVMPPDYNDLPVPTSKKNNTDETQKVISLLGINSETTISEINSENETLENSILKKIKNNNVD